MKKSEFKKIIKENVKSILVEMETYDQKTDQFSVGPRDRIEPSQDPDQRLLTWAKNRLRNENNPNNIYALQRVIDMISKSQSSKLKESLNTIGWDNPTDTIDVKDVANRLIELATDNGAGGPSGTSNDSFPDKVIVLAKKLLTIK